MAILEKQMCNEKGQWLAGNPEEIAEILAQLHENLENAKNVRFECSENGAPAWLYSVNVFQGMEKIHIHPAKELDLRNKIMIIEDHEICLTQDEGGVSVRVLSLPGCISQGESEEEAVKNIKDAMKGYLETAKKYGVFVRR